MPDISPGINLFCFSLIVAQMHLKCKLILHLPKCIHNIITAYTSFFISYGNTFWRCAESPATKVNDLDYGKCSFLAFPIATKTAIVSALYTTALCYL